MSNKRERERRREERLEKEGEAHGEERRKHLLQLSAGITVAALVVVALVIVVSQSQGGGGGGGGDTNLEDVGLVEDQLHGIPQRGTVLGKPTAGVTLIEFGDLQCPVCKAYSEEVIPQIVSGPVRDGEAKIEFRNFTIISEQSVPAGAAAIAAGEQHRAWNYIELFYRNQGEEGSGYVTNAFMTSIAKGAGVPNLKDWNVARRSKRALAEVESTTKQASEGYEFSGTPSFVVKGPGGTESLGTPGSAEAIEEAITNVS